jgi:phosphoglycerol transferase MdoB-like AlkP superfamily enzyme
MVDLRVEKFTKIQEMNEVEAISITRELITSPDTEFVNDIFPIYRKTIPKLGVGKPNIMLVILESWPAKYVSEEFSSIIEGKEITPEFNKLKKQGAYFPKFFANGGRTSNGLVSILTGIPDRPGISLVHTKYALNRFTGLGNVLKKAGYRTKFYYGGQLSFENLTPLVRHWGFDELYDYESFQAAGKFQKGIWGFNDLDVYNQIIYDLKNEPSTDHD